MTNLSELELQINQGLHQGANVVCRVGGALAQIRDRKLYKECGYRSFEKYVNDKFSMTRARAYHLISAAEIISDLQSHFQGRLLPQNESVVRPLMGFSRDQRIKIWKAVLEAYPSPRREDVAQIAQEYLSA
jgi:hypothetical protein